jgi:hypothetical protein
MKAPALNLHWQQRKPWRLHFGLFSRCPATAFDKLLNRAMPLPPFRAGNFFALCATSEGRAMIRTSIADLRPTIFAFSVPWLLICGISAAWDVAFDFAAEGKVSYLIFMVFLLQSGPVPVGLQLDGGIAHQFDARLERRTVSGLSHVTAV